MFSPTAGLPEDPATRSASAILAAQLLSGGALGAGETRLALHQGVEMGRPSLLRTTATRGPDGIRATVGGGCVKVMEGTAFL